MINKEFKLFSNCLVVKGISKGIVIDVQRKIYHIFPNQILDFLNEYSGQKIYNLFVDFHNDKSILKKYINYFLDNELVILTDDSSEFPSISDNFERPFEIDTIILDIDLQISNSIYFLTSKIDKLGISCLKLIFENSEIQDVINVLQLIDASKIKVIIILMRHRKGLELQLSSLKLKFARVVEIIFFAVSEESFSNLIDSNKFVYEKKTLNEILSMKIRSQDDFVLNIDTFNESLNFNTGYNRTVYIDNLGNIKRHIEDQFIFGNIAVDDLNEVVINPKIKEFWGINKDKILICKDCEFRYICPDGSIPFKLEETDSFYSTKTKCNYDPYKNLWNNA